MNSNKFPELLIYGFIILLLRQYRLLVRQFIHRWGKRQFIVYSVDILRLTQIMSLDNSINNRMWKRHSLWPQSEKSISTYLSGCSVNCPLSVIYPSTMKPLRGSRSPKLFSIKGDEKEIKWTFPLLFWWRCPSKSACETKNHTWSEANGQERTARTEWTRIIFWNHF